MPVESWVTYLEDGEYFRVDFGGPIDDAGLVSRHVQLINALRTHLYEDAMLRLLFDTRYSKFESPAVHSAMREVFGRTPDDLKAYDVRVALLNPDTDGRAGVHEAFFTGEADAVSWLVRP